MKTLSKKLKTLSSDIDLKKSLGNIIILIALITLSYIYYPIALVYSPYQANIEVSDYSYSVSIPKINAVSPVMDDVNPFIEAQYQAALEKGVASGLGFADPGENSLIYLFAHSSGSPLRQSRYNTVFLRLGELNNGDQINLKKDGKNYNYQVSDKKEIWPSEVEKYLKSKNENILVLQTCTPIGTSLKRLLIFAKPVSLPSQT